MLPRTRPRWVNALTCQVGLMHISLVQPIVVEVAGSKATGWVAPLDSNQAPRNCGFLRRKIGCDICATRALRGRTECAGRARGVADSVDWKHRLGGPEDGQHRAHDAAPLICVESERQQTRRRGDRELCPAIRDVTNQRPDRTDDLTSIGTQALTRVSTISDWSCDRFVESRGRSRSISHG